MKERFTKIVTFIKNNALFIAPVVLFLFFMFLLVFSYTQSPKTKYILQTTPAPTLSSTSEGFVNSSPQNKSISPQPQITSASDGIGARESDDLGWAGNTFSSNDLSDVKADKTILADGSVQYTYDSGTPNRPDMIIVKDGIIIFQRTPVYKTTIDDYKRFYKNPQYTAKGSRFWGQNTVTYIFLSKGFAFAGDTTTNQTVEQMYFKPVSLNEFKQKYAEDIIGDITPAP